MEITTNASEADPQIDSGQPVSQTGDTDLRQRVAAETQPIRNNSNDSHESDDQSQEALENYSVQGEELSNHQPRSSKNLDFKIARSTAEYESLGLDVTSKSRDLSKLIDTSMITISSTISSAESMISKFQAENYESIDLADLPGDFISPSASIGPSRSDMTKSQQTLLPLVVHTENLELQEKFVQQTRMQLANMVSGFFDVATNLDPNSPTSQRVNAAIGSLNARDLQLELQARRLQSQNKAVSEEIKRVSQSIEKEIRVVFSTEKSRIDEKELAKQEHQQDLSEKELAEQEQQQNLDEKELAEQEQQQSLGDYSFQPRIGNNEDNASDVSSIMSVDSFWAHSSSSSRSSLSDVITAVDEFVALLTQDSVLQHLCRLAIPRMAPEKFEMNLARILQKYSKGLKEEAMEALHLQAARFIGSRKRSIAAKVRIEFDPRFKTSLNRFSTEKSNKQGQLERFLKQFSPSGKEVDDHGHVEENGPEGSETSEAENSFENLSKVKEFLVKSTAFETLRENLKAFVDPPATTRGAPGDRKEIEDQAKATGLRAKEIDYRFPSTIGIRLVRKRDWLQQKFCLLLDTFNNLLRPPLVNGYRRIEWVCDCGKHLYCDFDDTNPTEIDDLMEALTCRIDQEISGFREEDYSPSANSFAIGPLSGDDFGTVAGQFAAPFPGQEAGISSSAPAENLTQRNLSGQNIRSSVDAVSGSQQKSPRSEVRINKFLELCVNTGKHSKSLREITLAQIRNDGDLFMNIRDGYLSLRGFRAKTHFLLEPAAVHFVRFCVEDRHRVGILESPLSLPPADEVSAKRYEYRPCPLNPPPIPSNIFLHLLSSRVDHPRSVWMDRLPKKLEESIYDKNDSLPIGWGVHIIEGPNRQVICWVLVSIVSLSLVVSILWATLNNDLQGGFSIGAWMVAVPSVIVLAFVFKWSDD